MNLQQKRILMTVLGVSLGGFAVGLFNYSQMGMDPFQVFAHGLNNLIPLGFGTFYAILNLIILIIIFFIDRKKIGLGTCINMFLLGYVVEFSSWLWSYLFPNGSFILRVVMLILGIVIMCFGSSLYFTANMGVSTYDAIALYISENTKFKFQYCRITTDLICVIIGVIFGAIAGIGTLITAFFMGPIISFFQRKFANPFLYGKENI